MTQHYQHGTAPMHIVALGNLGQLGVELGLQRRNLLAFVQAEALQLSTNHDNDVIGQASDTVSECTSCTSKPR